MAATTVDRNTPCKAHFLTKSMRVKGATKILLGTLVTLDANGFAQGAANAAGHSDVVGVARETVDNTAGADGALRVRVDEGVFAFAVNADIIEADITKLVHVDDNQTVRESAGATPVKAGVFVEKDVEGLYWFKVGTAVGK